LIKLFTQAHWSHSQSHTIMYFKLVEAEALLQVHPSVAILEIKKWGGHCGAKGKVGGATNVYLAW